MKHDDGSHGCKRDEDKKIEVLHKKALMLKLLIALQTYNITIENINL